jgi:hypothetical protein
MNGPDNIFKNTLLLTSAPIFANTHKYFLTGLRFVTKKRYNDSLMTRNQVWTFPFLLDKAVDCRHVIKIHLTQILRLGEFWLGRGRRARVPRVLAPCFALRTGINS